MCVCLDVQLLNVEANPNMKQYVGLLELVCSSCPIPTAEVLQDVSVLYARLGEDGSGLSHIRDWHVSSCLRSMSPSVECSLSCQRSTRKLNKTPQ